MKALVFVAFLILSIFSKKHYDLVIIGTGLSGMNAADSAVKRGIPGSEIIVFGNLKKSQTGGLMDDWQLGKTGIASQYNTEVGFHAAALMEPDVLDLGLELKYPFDYSLPGSMFTSYDAPISNEMIIKDKITGEQVTYPISSGSYWNDFCMPFPTGRRALETTVTSVWCVDELPKNQLVDILQTDVVEMDECTKKYRILIENLNPEGGLKNFKKKFKAKYHRAKVVPEETEESRRKLEEEPMEFCFDEHGVPYAVKVWLPWVLVIDDLLNFFPQDTPKIFEWWFFTLNIAMGGPRYPGLMSTKEVLQYFFPENDHIRTILALPALVPAESPHLLAYKVGNAYVDFFFWIFGQPFYFMDGSTKGIKDRMLKKLDDAGITVKHNSRVEEFLLDENKVAKGVKLSNGNTYYAK